MLFNKQHIWVFTCFFTSRYFSNENNHPSKVISIPLSSWGIERFSDLLQTYFSNLTFRVLIVSHFHFELCDSFKSDLKFYLYFARFLKTILLNLTTLKKICNYFFSLLMLVKWKIFSTICSSTWIHDSSMNIFKNSTLLTFIMAFFLESILPFLWHTSKHILRCIVCFSTFFMQSKLRLYKQI